MLVDPHGPPGRIRGVEQRLRRRVGVGRSEHTRAQPVARDDIGLVQRQVGDELDGPAGAVGRELLPEPVEAGRQCEQPHVDGAGSQRRHPAGRRCRPFLVLVAPRLEGLVEIRRHQLLDVPGRRIRLEMGPHDAAHRVEGGAAAIDQDSQITGGDRVQGDHGGASRRLGRKGAGVSTEEHAVGPHVDRPPSRT